MKLLKVALSKEAPNMRDVLWLKPVTGGVALYALFDGKWNPVKLMNDNGTVAEYDEYGAAAAVLGTDTDSSTDMTLYGLKAYIDSEIAGLG